MHIDQIPESQRFVGAAEWAREHGVAPKRVRISLQEASLPGVLLGRRWVVDRIRAAQMLSTMPQRPAA